MKKEKHRTALPDKEIPTEAFSVWLEKIRAAHKRNEGVDVPCGECRACCTSSYFIHIYADEQETIKAIPKELVFPAPGMPDGTMVLGFFKNGHCPMLKNNECSMYKKRSRTCRKYDCRVFTAAGYESDCGKPLIEKQARSWRFSFPSKKDEVDFRAVRAAAAFIKKYKDSFPEGFITGSVSKQAMIAIQVYEVFQQKENENADGWENRKTEIINAVVDAFTMQKQDNEEPVS